MSSDFNKLRKLWYKKLETSKSEEYPNGFKDIEANDFRLKEPPNKFTRDRALWSWEAKESYYHMARKFLNDYKFDSNRERIIWEYHTEGISIRDIVKLLKKSRLKSVYRRVVWETVNKLEKTMKKMYMQGFNE